MTVCIAAGFDAGGVNPGIVFCADTRMGGHMGKADNALKIRRLSSNWAVAVAGTDDEALVIHRDIRSRATTREAKDKTPCDAATITQIVREALGARKREKVEEFVQSRYAISYDKLLADGKQCLPDDLFREAMAGVRDVRLEAEFVLGGFDNGFPFIIETDTDGKVRAREDYGVVGAGANLALSVMLNREHLDVRNLSNALYTAYEAKRYAEGHSSVSEFAVVNVLRKDGTFETLESAGHTWLKAQFKELGPKALPKTLEVPEGALKAS